MAKITLIGLADKVEELLNKQKPGSIDQELGEHISELVRRVRIMAQSGGNMTPSENPFS
jgi:hypothetical protein